MEQVPDEGSTATPSHKRKLVADEGEKNGGGKVLKHADTEGNITSLDSLDSAELQSQPKAEKTNGAGAHEKEQAVAVDLTVAPGKTFETLDGFVLKNVLSNSADYKRVVIEGLVGEQSAIIILDKKPFVAENLTGLLSAESKLQHTFQNDIYGSYDCTPNSKSAEIKTTIVFPATQKHIDKYVHQPLYLINETPEIYAKVTLPYLEKSTFSIQWVYNILEHKQEADRIVFEDTNPETGFILLPDLKWDGKAIENLYLTAIVHSKGIKSIRELNASHLPLLTNIWENGTKAILEKYGLKASQLRIYMHYQPSYYHLHVHFTSLQFNAPGIYTEKSHLLQTVIDNIKGKSSFYQEATLPFVVKENDHIFNSLKEFGYSF